ncbi:MAG TPA: hypothetical protein VF824_16930 [Thermoanaerobaculia bacterium]
MAASGGRERGLHARGIPAKQRAHLAAVLIALALLLSPPAHAQSEDDIAFDPTITDAQFAEFSRLVAQGIYATPVDPARARGLLGFDIGVAATAVPVDPNAPYYQQSTTNDFTIKDYVAVPRLIVSKGLSVATVSAMYAKVPDSDIRVLGGALDVPLISGGLLKPTLAVRGAYSQLQGVENFELKTYGVEVFLSKGFGPVTPYAGVGRSRSDARGTVPAPLARTLRDQADQNRITVGVKLSLLLPKIVVEATQAEVRSYAAKISFGL